MNDRLKICLDLYRNKSKELKDKAIDRYQYYKWLNDYESFKELMNENEFKEVIRFKKNRYYKRYRANKKILPMLGLNDDRLVFVTMTFNDEQLKLSEETRTKKINQWLKDHFTYCIANIDYGKETEREHHHAIGYMHKDEELEAATLTNGKQVKSDKGNLLYEFKRKNYKEILKCKETIFEPDICKIDINDEDIKCKKLTNYLVKRINDHTNKVSTRNRRLRVLY